MNYFLTIIAATLTLISCSKKEEIGFEIKGKATSFTEKDMFFLEVQDGADVKVVDTALVEKGAFSFTGNQASPELHFITIKGVQGKFPIIIENGTITVNINKDSLQNIKVGGTFNNDELQKFKTGEISQVKLEMKAYERINNEKMIQAHQNNDTQVMDVLQKGYQEFIDRIEKLNNEYVDKNPTSYVSILLLEDMMYNPTSNAERLKKQYNNLSSELKNTKKGLFIIESLNKMTQIEVGNQAPNFTAPTPDGKALALNDLKSKLILIDFWASWCKPCRVESPYLVKMYAEFKPLGLEIISISLDEDAEKWKNAIGDDKLNWNHVSNLQSWNEPIAKLYNVKSIPATFLVDSKGIIIAKDLRQEDLHAKIKEILKKQ